MFMKQLKCHFYFIVFIFLITTNGVAQGLKTFTNPLLPAGADPWCTYKDGYYYYTHTTGKNITIWKTRSMPELKTAEKKVVFEPTGKGEFAKDFWAPEIHFLKGRWYIYFAANGEKNTGHRLWVLENSSSDPLKGEWTMKGKLTTPDDKWSIDCSVFENKGQLFAIWSGWEGNTNNQQNIYIAKMKNPWTIEGARTKVSSPDLDWEKYGDLNKNDTPSHVNVNEGPEILKHQNDVFLIYSASGCWTDYYALGELKASINSDLLNANSWTKKLTPIFKQSKENKVYAPGHNSFFKSPDGKQDFILYHANDAPGEGCGQHRSPRAQQFTWDKYGEPIFGIPVKKGQQILLPSGTNLVSKNKN